MTLGKPPPICEPLFHLLKTPSPGNIGRKNYIGCIKRLAECKANTRYECYPCSSVIHQGSRVSVFSTPTGRLPVCREAVSQGRAGAVASLRLLTEGPWFPVATAGDGVTVVGVLLGVGPSLHRHLLALRRGGSCLSLGHLPHLPAHPATRLAARLQPDLPSLSLCWF